MPKSMSLVLKKPIVPWSQGRMIVRFLMGDRGAEADYRYPSGRQYPAKWMHLNAEIGIVRRWNDSAGWSHGGQPYAEYQM
jgi:hypothetical protein